MPGPADDTGAAQYRPLLSSIAYEVFGYGYPDVARITGKTEVNCREIFARARQRIAGGRQ